MQAGDTVIVKAGIYRESVMPAYSGDDGNPITFQANPGDRVVVSGAEEITGWQQLTQELSEGNPNHANIYYKDINWVPRLLYEDGVKCRKARKPDCAACPVNDLCPSAFTFPHHRRQE